MEPLYLVISNITSGIALALGVVSIFNYFFKGKEKIDLAFGMLCLVLFTYIQLPPTGFISIEEPQVSTSIKAKRFLNIFFIGLFPWFIYTYTGYKNRMVPLISSVALGICSLIMFGITKNAFNQLWDFTSLIFMVLILVHGFYSAVYQYKKGDKTMARWLFMALVSLTLLNIVGFIGLSGKSNFLSNPSMILLASNLFLLGFVLILGIYLLSNPNKLFLLESRIRSREKRWKALLEQIQAIIITTDSGEKITNINEYGVALLNYNNASELINTNLSDHFSNLNDTINDSEADSYKNLSSILKKNTVHTKDGKEKIITWTSTIIYNDEGEITGKMYIGSDITLQEESIQQIQQLKQQLEKENFILQKDPPPFQEHKGIIGNSRPFMYAIQKSNQVAATNASVLLLGETGVGKECFADLIQLKSLRSNKPFIKVNCGALPAELIESELFGHEKGAFTGAVQARMGRFEKANGGTIFLDEIGELPLVLQPKLLRVLQNGEFERVGGHQTIKVDVRIIAATNSDLEKEVKENRFRDDLFYRLNVFPITIPPLRKRNGDIMLLIQHFIETKSREHGKQFENISKSDMNRLCDYEWPGNIRELKNVIERAVISSDNSTLKLDWFYEDIENSQSSSITSLEEMETAHILKVLQECRWKINGENGAAEKLVMHPNTLRSRMKKLKINVPWKHEPAS